MSHLFPEKFIKRYSPIISDFYNFLDTLRKPLRQTFRVNTLKTTKQDVMKLTSDLRLEPVFWYDLAFRINERVNFGHRIEHYLGLIYVQELASMIPALVLEPKPNEKILDISAAPGSKTTQISAMMKNTGLIIANDISLKRIAKLISNIERLGVLNVVITNQSGKKLGYLLPEFFDRAIVDAPCSLEGTIRKSTEVLCYWSEANIQRLAKIQRWLINSAFQSLKPNGLLVYSTCTYAPEENEAIVDYLLKKYPNAKCESIAIPGIIIRPGIREWRGYVFDNNIQKTIRIYPQDNDTEGFYIAKIRKL